MSSEETTLQRGRKGEISCAQLAKWTEMPTVLLFPAVCGNEHVVSAS